MPNKDIPPKTTNLCKNIFKDGTTTTTAARFTKQWAKCNSLPGSANSAVKNGEGETI